MGAWLHKLRKMRGVGGGSWPRLGAGPCVGRAPLEAVEEDRSALRNLGPFSCSAGVFVPGIPDSFFTVRKVEDIAQHDVVIAYCISGPEEQLMATAFPGLGILFAESWGGRAPLGAAEVVDEVAGVSRRGFVYRYPALTCGVVVWYVPFPSQRRKDGKWV